MTYRKMDKTRRKIAAVEPTRSTVKKIIRAAHKPEPKRATDADILIYQGNDSRWLWQIRAQKFQILGTTGHERRPSALAECRRHMRKFNIREHGYL